LRGKEAGNAREEKTGKRAVPRKRWFENFGEQNFGDGARGSGAGGRELERAGAGEKLEETRGMGGGGLAA
jgi:hypothetical protein